VRDRLSNAGTLKPHTMRGSGCVWREWLAAELRGKRFGGVLGGVINVRHCEVLRSLACMICRLCGRLSCSSSRADIAFDCGYREIKLSVDGFSGFTCHADIGYASAGTAS
jgi:hypothetical protein